MSHGDQNGWDSEDAPVPDEVWPELDRAEELARGAALKWASGVFCHPEHLERLAHYRKRESQRTASINSRLKAVVQSYLEGVGWGLRQLREARSELVDVSHAMDEVRLESSKNAEGISTLDTLREVSINHCQLLAAVSNLPRLCSVQSIVLETERLVESRRLLEAHARLMELESWQDGVLLQLHSFGLAGKPLCPEDEELVQNYFSGVGRLVEALARELWTVVGNGLTLSLQNPTPFVSAVRIVEREEALDRFFLEERKGGPQGRPLPLPPGRPRCWREHFFKVLEEAVAARFRSVSYQHSRGPGLAGHLSALQHSILGDLTTVRNLLEQCVPPHYHLTKAYLHACHRCLQAHLKQTISWELQSGEIFAILNWVLHVYSSSEMMGSPALSEYLDLDELGPLVSQEGVDQLQNKYVQSVRKSVSEWMQKTLEVELTDWQRDQEPDIDHEGCYHTTLPTIITQMLEENARVAVMIGEPLRDQTILMGLYEMENLLTRFRDAIVEFGKEHRKNPTGSTNDFYLHYLLACISNCIILKSSTESLYQQVSSRSSRASVRLSRIPPGPLGALDRAVRKACRLAMDQLLLELQPHLQELLTRTWLLQGDVVSKVCGVLQRHCDLYRRARSPCRQRLQEEALWLTVVEYVRALMQKRLICRSEDERQHTALQMSHDAQLLAECFRSTEVDGTPGEMDPTSLIPLLADLIKLKDPGMLMLEVSGLISKYPDISEEHVSTLLEVRGDVPRDVKVSILCLVEQSSTALPPGYRPIFPDILVPPPSMPFCLPTSKCA